MKKVLCYFLLLFFIFLMILPPLLRIFAKDYGKKPIAEETVDTTEQLSCTLNSDTLVTTYFNGKAYSLFYNVIHTDTETDLEKIIKNFATSTYNATTNITEYKINFNETIDSGLSNYNMPIVNQKAYYMEKGFTCSVNKF